MSTLKGTMVYQVFCVVMLVFFGFVFVSKKDEVMGEKARSVAANSGTAILQMKEITPLMKAIIDKKDAEVELLLAQGADPNQRFPLDRGPQALRGKTLLMAAVANPRQLEMLLNAGANPSAKSASGETLATYFKQMNSEPAMSKAVLTKFSVF